MNKKTEHHEIELLFTDDSVHITLPSREPGIQYKIVNKSERTIIVNSNGQDTISFGKTFIQ